MRASFIMWNMDGETVMRFAHQLADTCAVFAERQHRRGRAAPAHLVNQSRQRDVVARAEAAVVVDVEFRHGEQRDAFDPRRPARNAREHQVNDVLAQFMIAG